MDTHGGKNSGSSWLLGKRRPGVRTALAGDDAGNASGDDAPCGARVRERELLGLLDGNASGELASDDGGHPDMVARLRDAISGHV